MLRETELQIGNPGSMQDQSREASNSLRTRTGQYYNCPK